MYIATHQKRKEEKKGNRRRYNTNKQKPGVPSFCWEGGNCN
jgi:hypothetical protein